MVTEIFGLHSNFLLQLVDRVLIPIALVEGFHQIFLELAELGRSLEILSLMNEALFLLNLCALPLLIFAEFLLVGLQKGVILPCLLDIGNLQGYSVGLRCDAKDLQVVECLLDIGPFDQSAGLIVLPLLYFCGIIKIFLQLLNFNYVS